MTQSQSASLMKPDQGTDVVTPTPKRAVAERGGLRLWRREKVVKESALAALLKPIALALALILSSYALLSLGTSFYRSYHRNLEHSAATHPDRSVLDILFPDSRLPADPVDLVVKDIDGKLHKMVASKSETDNFVNDTILMLDEERARIKRTAREDLDRNFSIAFQDREKAISDYADWFFAWKRSYVVLKESLGSAITRFFEAGRYQTLSEAVETDLREYFLTHYKDQVLRPELRDQVISQGVEQAARHAHDSYRRVIANGDMRLQLFLAKHTRHLEEVPASAPVTKLKLDWDAQKWKAPTYLMQDRAFDGIVGLGTAAAGGTVGALALGPVLNRVLAQSFGQLSRRLVGSLGTRLAFAQQGAVAGTVVQPVGGQVIGAAIGAMVGIAADYLGNAANEAFNREEFIAANDRALDATIETWKAGLAANLDAAVDKWFDDARSSVVLTAR